MNNRRTRIKICGITRPEDALLVAEAGADALGLVFYAPSPRAVSIAQARRICEVLPAFVTVVALFVNPERDEVEAVLDALPIDLLQFHGQESAAFAASFARPYIKAVPMGELAPAACAATVGDHPAAQGFLYDKFDPARIGGTGEVFDWSQLPQDGAASLILAGGLDAGNVATAIRTVKPYAVDVSSGVERDKGLKCGERIHAFCEAVRQADAGG